MGSRSGIFWEKIILGHKNQVEEEKDTGKRQKKAPGRQSGGEGAGEMGTRNG